MRMISARTVRATVNVVEHDDGHSEVIIAGDSGDTTLLPAGPYTDRVARAVRDARRGTR